MWSLANKFLKELAVNLWNLKYISLAYPGLCKKINKFAKKKDYDEIGE